MIARRRSMPMMAVAISPLGSRDIAVLFIYDSRGEFIYRINATVGDDGYEGHSFVQELDGCFEGLFSGRLGDLYYPLRLTRLALYNKHSSSVPALRRG
jgi:hypothetical protein